jgi:hypothetical protein
MTSARREQSIPYPVPDLYEENICCLLRASRGMCTKTGITVLSNESNYLDKINSPYKRDDRVKQFPRLRVLPIPTHSKMTSQHVGVHLFN